MNGRWYADFCFSAYDIYDTFNKKQLKIHLDVIQKKYKVNKRQRLCVSVLIYCLYLVILDIIQNNDTFVLPLKTGKQATIHVKPVVGDDLKRARQKGAFQDIDLLASNFTAYNLAMDYEGGGKQKEKIIHLTKPYQKMLIDNINAGKVYY